MIFTIGHSNHDLAAFLDLVRMHGIDVLADVRTYPASKYCPQFNAESLKKSLRAIGVAYVSMGDQLGGRPSGEEFYDDDGHVLYGRLAEAPAFQEGIRRIETGCDGRRIALMCSEEDPARCHRHLLVGRVLAADGFEVAHIRGDGRLIQYEELEDQNARPRQRLLFDNQETEEWRSIQSVSPGKKPMHSSAHSETTASND